MTHPRLFSSVLMAMVASSALARPPRDILTPTEPAQQQQQQSDHATEQTSEQNDQRQRDEAPRNPPMSQMDPIQCWPDGGLVSKLAWIPLLGDKLNPQNADDTPKMKEDFLGLRLDSNTGEMLAYFAPHSDPPPTAKELSKLDLASSNAHVIKLPPNILKNAYAQRTEPSNVGLLRKARNLFRRETQREVTTMEWVEKSKREEKVNTNTTTLNIKRSQVKSGLLGRKRKEVFSGTIDFGHNDKKASFSLKCKADPLTPPDFVP